MNQKPISKTKRRALRHAIHAIQRAIAGAHPSEIARAVRVLKSNHERPTRREARLAERIADL